MAQTVGAAHQADRRAPARWWAVVARFRLLSVVVLASAAAGVLTMCGADRPARWLVIVVAGAVGIRLAASMIGD